VHREKITLMKTSIQATLAGCALLASFAISTSAQTQAAEVPANSKLLNAYGEPAGFGNPPDVVISANEDVSYSASTPGSAGLYRRPGTGPDRRNFESLGAWQERKAVEANATVIIGTLEVISSGPTGPITPEVRSADSAEVTGQVQARIQATDKSMAALKSRARALDETTKTRFDSAADEVAMRRQTLREDLKTMRTAGDDQQWASARTTLAASYNAYVQSQHRAEEIVLPATSSNS
jgi:hypothetical protein